MRSGDIDGDHHDFAASYCFDIGQYHDLLKRARNGYFYRNAECHGHLYCVGNAWKPKHCVERFGNCVDYSDTFVECDLYVGQCGIGRNAKL